MKMQKQVKARYKALAMVLSVLMLFAFMPSMTYAATPQADTPSRTDAALTIQDNGAKATEATWGTQVTANMAVKESATALERVPSHTHGTVRLQQKMHRHIL